MLSKDELHSLAAAGVVAAVLDIEKQLAAYHKEWPHLFLSPTAPQLLKAQPKAAATNGNGHWPKIVATKRVEPKSELHQKAAKKGWTDERRAKFRATMAKKYANSERRRNARRGSPEHAAKMRASWTPERRAKMARLMKKRSKAMHAAKAARRAKEAGR